MTPTICTFDNSAHRDQVIVLWKAVFGYEAAHDRPALVIDKKLEVEDDLFFVALIDDKIIGTIMAGYDGHRGWIYSVAVHPEHRKQGIGYPACRSCGACVDRAWMHEDQSPDRGRQRVGCRILCVARLLR